VSSRLVYTFYMPASLVPFVAAVGVACGPKVLEVPKPPGAPCDPLGRCGDGLACHGAYRAHELEPGRCFLEPGRCLADRDCPGALEVCDRHLEGAGRCVEAPAGIPKK
jgi:hypothetical protein